MERQPNMEEKMKLNFMLLEGATGLIEAGPEQQERLDEITERLLGDEFYVSVSQKIPSKCIDGRTGAEGYAPNAAGGTESIMVADDLTYRRFSASSTLESYANVINYLQHNNLPIGGHTDEMASEPASGCGANDKAEIEYGLIASRGDEIRALASIMGIEVAEEDHAMIVANAAARTEFSPGSELLTILETADESAVDTLRGPHREVIAMINKQPGTTLDRNALEAEFGQDYEAFNIDVWSFQEAAAAIAEDEAQIPAIVAAMTYFNIAVALTLCGPGMRVSVRSKRDVALAA